MTLRTRLLWPLRLAVAWYDDRQWARMNPNQQAEAIHMARYACATTRSGGIGPGAKQIRDSKENAMTRGPQIRKLTVREWDALRAVHAQPTDTLDGLPIEGQCRVTQPYTEPIIGELLLLWFVWVPVLVVCIGPITLAAWGLHGLRAAWRWGREMRNDERGV